MWNKIEANFTSLLARSTVSLFKMRMGRVRGRLQ
jgi:hypothetical protein